MNQCALTKDLHYSLVKFLVQHKTTFAWTHSDIEGIHSKIITHQLSIVLETKPIQQKRRTFAPKRNQAVAQEVSKLIVVNIVMVMKANGSGRYASTLKTLIDRARRIVSPNSYPPIGRLHC